MSKRRLHIGSLVGCVFILLSSIPANAADTTELFGPGPCEVDFFAGFDGIGLTADEQGISGDMMLGYGVLGLLSSYLGIALSENGQLADGAADLYLGIYGTAIESDHIDLDLVLDFSSAGAHFDRFRITPSTEVNFDLDPEMQSWGAYLRAGLPVYGRETPAEDPAEPAEEETSFHVEATAGTYLTIAGTTRFFWSSTWRSGRTPRRESARPRWAAWRSGTTSISPRLSRWSTKYRWTSRRETTRPRSA
jgi:hypothetical protein